ncbi:MAG TPA: hypothetical protein VIY08_06400 [Candidatus Nitrosocosmicus sp.]
MSFYQTSIVSELLMIACQACLTQIRRGYGCQVADCRGRNISFRLSSESFKAIDIYMVPKLTSTL